MAGNITFTIIKPMAVTMNNTGAILHMITEAGFTVSALKMLQLNRAEAKKFYAIHEGKPFFDTLIEFMVSGPIVVAILKKDNAVEDYRKLIGSTDPSKAEEGTIRKRFAISVQQNAVHGSDSDENAAAEAKFFFADHERF